MPRLPAKAKAATTPLEGLSAFANDPPPTDAPAEIADAPETAPEPAKRASRAKPRPATAEQQAALSSGDDFGFAALDDTIDYLNVLFYGREGTAKTTALAAAANIAPPGSKVLVVNAEGGLKTVALKRRGIDTSRIVVWPAPGSGVEITAKTLERLHDKLNSDLMRDPNSWFLVGLDSMTDIYESIRSQATRKRIAKVKAKDGVDPSLVDEDFVDRDDYGVMSNQLRPIFRDLRDLPCHLVITALERVDDGITGPAISPALAKDILGYVDCTLYFRASQHAAGEDEDQALAEFRALTRPGKVTRAKDRFDLLPRVLAEPTFPRVLGYILQTLDEETDPIQAAYVERRQAEEQAAAEAAAAKDAAKKERLAKKAPAKKATAAAVA